VRLPGGTEVVLDNGQHILLGAYRATFGLMREVGVDPEQVLLRMPLKFRFPDGSGLALPAWPAPLDAAAGIVTAKGWRWRDKVALLRTAASWRAARFQCPPERSVSEICHGITGRVMSELIAPLCESALNTPPDRASGQVFLRVMRDALFGEAAGSRGSSNLMLPRCSLGQLFPDAAARWLQDRRVPLRSGIRVSAIAPHRDGWLVEGEVFEAIVLACPDREAARLVQASGVSAEEWLRSTQSLAHEAITTVYVMGPEKPLSLPMLALRSGPRAPAQFVFDRGQLGGPAGLLAFVISASVGDRENLEREVLAQAQALGFGALTPVQTVVEKRATFACTPGLQRPGVEIAPGLLACGDYVAGPYPATLEGAVRSGLQAVACLRNAIT
jgi:squalene-associated FAD-dependent desaturase